MRASENLIEAAKQGDLERVKGILETGDRLANLRDESGATALHYAAMNGHRQIVQLLLERGADINSTDSQFGATPAGWAIEYLREMGGHLAIELDDLAHAIRLGDTRWVSRFLKRFPALRDARDTEGTPFQKLARESGNRDYGPIWIGGRSLTNLRDGLRYGHAGMCRKAGLGLVTEFFENLYP